MTGNDHLSDILDRLSKIALDSALVSQAGDYMLADRNSKYTSIKEYYEKTGKRFRISRNQKDRGLTREEAFQEFLQKQQKKK